MPEIIGFIVAVLLIIVFLVSSRYAPIGATGYYRMTLVIYNFLASIVLFVFAWMFSVEAVRWIIANNWGL